MLFETDRQGSLMWVMKREKGKRENVWSYGVTSERTQAGIREKEKKHGNKLISVSING